MKTYDILEFRQVNKGNLHTHTTRTDGEFSVQEVVDLYRQEGYKFIAITDHRIYYSQQEILSDLIILDGCEYNCYLDQNDRVHFHLLTLKDYKESKSDSIPHDDNHYKSLFYKDLSEVQNLIDELSSRGNIVLIAHPNNPFIPREFMRELNGYLGMEVYNTKAEQDATDLMKALFEDHPDMIFTAADDAHQLVDLSGEKRFFKGFIVVEDGDLNHATIIDAIKKKRFFASQGPLLERIEIEDGRIHIKCSEMNTITLHLYEEKSTRSLNQKAGSKPLKEAMFEMSPSSKSFIIECEDAQGRKAWFAY